MSFGIGITREAHCSTGAQTEGGKQESEALHAWR
jgi:hypothetical protein